MVTDEDDCVSAGFTIVRTTVNTPESERPRVFRGARSTTNLPYSCIEYDTPMTNFARTLRAIRQAADLSQTALAQRSGVARPNIVAYEHGRREPLFHNAVELLEAAGAAVHVELPVVWSWTADRRPYAVPSRLWRLPAHKALRSFDTSPHLWWSGPPRTFDLSRRDERLRAYEMVLREGNPSDIEEIVDGVLLCEAWPDLVLPRSLRSAWEPLIGTERDAVTLRTAS